MKFVLVEEGDLQRQGTSLLFAIFGTPSKWGSQDDMFQQKKFSCKIVLFDSIETKLAKESDTKKKEFQLLMFIRNLSNRYINFKLFSAF